MSVITSKLKKCAVNQWQTQAVNIKTNHKIKVKFCLPEFSATRIRMLNCHMYDSTKIRHDMVIGRHLPTVPGLNLKFLNK